MLGHPAIGEQFPHARSADPYRVLFDQLVVGAARCRPIVEGDDVVDVEILDSNRAFGALRCDLPRLFSLLTRVVRLGRPESVRLWGDGKILTASAYPVGYGEVDEVMVVIEDVTARDQLEQRSRESQTRFEQAFHGNAAAMVIARRSDLCIIDVNPRWLEMFGATRAEVIGKSPVELGLITALRASARIAEHSQFTEGYDVELKLSTRAGTHITVLASAKPIEIAEGTCTLTTLIDITARKQAEQAFAVAFSASPAGMILVEAASDLVVAVNDRMLEMTGDRREDLIGRRSSEIDIIDAPARAELLPVIEQTGRVDGVEVELSRNGRGGLWTLASVQTITLHDAPHRLSVFTDITTLRELNLGLERRVEDRTQALEASNRDLEAFSSSVSHDLRAPLRAILGFSEILLEDFAAALPGEARALLARIHTSGGRLRTLVDGLLSFSRIGRGEIARERIDLDGLVRSVLDELLAGRDLGDRLELHLGELGSCRADHTLLRTVWTNLLDNALKYSQARNPIVIDITRERRGDEFVYRVRDNGVGFDMAHANRLFGVFQRLHSASEFEGTGIGLANVRRIVECHHGRVAAHSELGSGSTFEFTLGIGTATQREGMEEP
jgi:PAS domain S-box-containing protein